ncbi:MAG: DnaJ domain-containing protein [Planctomycetes bacterium]|nr:DnaJ domain-containing protein [Planctomycetota bacterium]
MSVSFRDYYAILGVARDAKQDAIQHAYRALARKQHPDVDKSAGATKRFQELQEAYEVLKDPQKRARYDQLGANWKEGQSFTPPGGGGAAGDFEFQDLEGFSDFFASLFGQRRSAGGAGARTRVRFEHDEEERGDFDLHARLDLAPWEAALGAKVPFRHFDGSEVSLTVPAGSASGRELRLRGLGRPRRDGRRGDLYVELRIVVPAVVDEAQRKLWQELARVSNFDPRA